MIPGEGSSGGGNDGVVSTVQYSHAAYPGIINISSSPDTRPNNFKSWNQVNAQSEEITTYLFVGDKFTKTSLKLIIGFDTSPGGGGIDDADYVIDVTYIHTEGKNVADIDESIPITIAGPVEKYQEKEVTLNPALAEANCLVFVNITRDVNDDYSGNIKCTKVSMRSE